LPARKPFGPQGEEINLALRTQWAQEMIDRGFIGSGFGGLAQPPAKSRLA